jgi:membrane peptidoglycan carboxypeptidase
MVYICIVANASTSAVARFVTLVRAGLIAGVVSAAVAYPIAAVGGLGAKAGADLINGLPRNLNVNPQAQTTYLYAADGRTLLTTFYEEHRKYTPIGQISPYVQQAIVASEDARFFEHRGVDMKGIARAFVANQQAGAVSQGASTLTMQYVRIALRDSAQTPAEAIAATEQTNGRKIREMRFATELEKQVSKTEILERYLNAAYFGHRAYGIFAASEVFFSKRPKDLTLVEAATLAGLVKAPSGYDPAKRDRAAATDRRNYVVNRMVELGYISADAAAAAKKQPIRLRLTTPPNDCISVPRRYNSWGFFCDFLKSWWMSQPAFGANPGEREEQLRRGGYRIVLSIDPRVQQIAQRHVLNNLSTSSPYANGAVFVQPGTGLVKAMAVNRVYSLDQRHNGPHTDRSKRGLIPSTYPNTVNPLLGGGDLPGYQAGSTFKIFTLLAALDAGYPLSTSFFAPYRLVSRYLAGWSEPSTCGGRWCPHNASGAMTGRHNMWTGFGKSVNTYFVQLEQAIGAERVVRMAERLGLRWRTDVDKMMAAPGRANKWGAFTLGVADTTPLEMANAYATIAADGRYCEPLPVRSITGPDGKPVMYTPAGATRPVEVAKPRCTQAVSMAAARAATDAARCVTGYGASRGGCGGWSTGSMAYPMINRPFAGKTGTTDSTRAAWFVGFTPELAEASFVADPDHPLNAVGDRFYNDPIRAVAYTIRDSLAGKRVRYFSPPPRSILN